MNKVSRIYYLSKSIIVGQQLTQDPGSSRIPFYLFIIDSVAL